MKANERQITEKEYSRNHSGRRLTVDEIMRRTRRRVLRRRMMKKVSFIALAIVLLVFFVVIAFGGVTVKAQEEAKADNTVKTYMYITVEYGDTLWGIASEYADYHYDSINQYISEVKGLNGFTSDILYEGIKILIPVYVEA